VIDSILLQAHATADAAAVGAEAQPQVAGAGALGAHRLLQLAESMAARLVAQRNGAIQGVEALDLYLGILYAQVRKRLLWACSVSGRVHGQLTRQACSINSHPMHPMVSAQSRTGKHLPLFGQHPQDKAADALALLDGPLGRAFRMAAERRHARAALLSALGRPLEAAQLYREAVQEQPDDWTAVQLYLDCLLPPACSSQTAPPAGFLAVAKALGAPAAPAAMAAAAAGGEENAAGGGRGGAVEEALAEAEAFLDSLPTEPPLPPPADGGGNGADKPSRQRRAVPQVLRGPVLARVELAARRARLGRAPTRAVAEAVLACYERCAPRLRRPCQPTGDCCLIGRLSQRDARLPAVEPACHR
jgi:hypothetical protein